MPTRRLLPLLASLAIALPAAAADSDAGAYDVTVWAHVLFDETGAAKDIAIQDADSYPPRFVDNVRTRLGKARIPAPQHDGAPATFRTGVRLDFSIARSESGGAVRMKGLSMSPLPLTMPVDKPPAEVLALGEWKGAVTAICKVDRAGSCASSDVQAASEVPDAVRRYAKATVERWTFAPQEVNGKPVEGEFRHEMQLEQKDRIKPDDFRQNRFDQLMRGR